MPGSRSAIWAPSAPVSSHAPSTEDRRQVQRAVDLPDDLREHLDLVTTPGRVVEELGAFQHECRLVRERLRQTDLAVEEDAARPVADREGADHAILEP